MVVSLAPNLLLIGFMGSGKTTIGRLCAKALCYRFADTDERVEQKAQMTVSELFAELGEAEFRRLERCAVTDLCMRANAVIATGGGAVLDPDNVATMRASGIVVWLAVEPEEILRRCGTCQTRPLLAGAESPLDHIRSMMAAREPHYARAADVTVATTGLRREEAASRVLEAFRGAAETWPHVAGREEKA